MKRYNGGLLFVLASLLLVVGLGAAPAPPSYVGIERAIEQMRSKLAASTSASSADWNALCDEVLADLKAYGEATGENERLRALGKLFEDQKRLQTVSSWGPANELSAALNEWLAPRVSVAWAIRRVEDAIQALPAREGDGYLDNRQRWLKFLGEDVGGALKAYEGAKTAAQRADATESIRECLSHIGQSHKTYAWWPTLGLSTALEGLFSRSNAAASVDAGTAASFFSRQIIQPETITRKGQASYVTPGPYLGFGLMPYDGAIAFFNRQMAYSYTPIRGFQEQLAADSQGQRAAQMYRFTAATNTTSDTLATTLLTPTGALLSSSNTPDVKLNLSIAEQPGGQLARTVASFMGFSKDQIYQQVYQNAFPRIQQETIQGAREESAEKTARAQAELNGRIGQYLIGGNAAIFRSFALTGLNFKTRPEAFYAAGNLGWASGDLTLPRGADVPKPASLRTVQNGIVVDLHAPSVLTDLVEGAIQTEGARGVQNLLIETGPAPLATAESAQSHVTRNADYATFLSAIDRAKAANDPKVFAFRVFKPQEPPVFTTDKDGNLVALLKNFRMEVPAVNLPGLGQAEEAKAKVYRIESPRAEFVMKVGVAPDPATGQMRIIGNFVDLDPGTTAKVFRVGDDEAAAEPLNLVSRVTILGTLRARVKGRPLDFPIPAAPLQGMALQSVSPLDSTGWVRLVLQRVGYPAVLSVR